MCINNVISMILNSLASCLHRVLSLLKFGTWFSNGWELWFKGKVPKWWITFLFINQCKGKKGKRYLVSCGWQWIGVFGLSRMMFSLTVKWLTLEVVDQIKRLSWSCSWLICKEGSDKNLAFPEWWSKTLVSLKVSCCRLVVIDFEYPFYSL